MKEQNRFDQIASISAVVILIAGCFVVLKPFLSALVWAAIICYSTWPIYDHFEKWMKGRRTLAATIMTLMIVLVIVVPLVLLGISLANNAQNLIPIVKSVIRNGIPEAPEWLAKIPFVGTILERYWTNLPHSNEQMVEVAKKMAAEWKGWVLTKSLDFGQMMAQLVLSVFISFFIYRDGMTILERLSAAENRIAGIRTQKLLDVIGGTVKGVVYGIIGTAAAQGTLAGIGLWISGVPFPVWLGFTTFFLSLLPMGPPLVWGGASIWLFYQDSIGWMVFMLIWGFFVVSGVDNILKPYLISRGSNLPFVLVFLGVFGGMIAFGIIGIFVGPTLIAVGYVLLQEWSSKQVEVRDS